MAVIARTLVDPVTYRRLAYLLLGMPLGTMWFVALVTLWSLSFGLIVTPMVIPVLLALAFVTYGIANVEAELARSLLGVSVHAPSLPGPGGTWRTRLRALFGGGFWRAQGYIWTRWFLGFPAGVVMVGLLGTAVSMIVGPFWIPFLPASSDVYGIHAHTLLQSLVLVPVGLVLLPLTLALAHPFGALFKPLAISMLNDTTQEQQQRQAPGPARAGLALAGPTRRGLRVHAVVEASVVAVLIVIWAVTSLGYFWPIWIVLPFASALAMHAWLVELAERPQLVRRFRGSKVLAATVGIAGAFWLFTVAVWAVSSHQYFWPIWTLLGLVIVVGAETAAVLLGSPHDAEMAERIETLTATRAGAVNVQDSELRRIERDLHDGAQARLVALGMSLGMAEQKLADDPERAGELLAEARVGAEQALRELRDLARGIHPPVLADRGLEAAISALANSTPMHVALSVDVPKRPSSAVESAAYFVTAESLANAAKHAKADWLDIRIATVGSNLELEITDDGIGGADPNGSGLVGLRRRVEALDGTLEVTSPPGGPTTVYAELPCV
jgi:signal transduction histidine kinase